jgi:hypothetical protein
VSDDTHADEILEALAAAGLAEVYLNADGTAVGAAMLGFEQALRSEPPPEILASEHVPERGLSGAGDAMVIEFPHRGHRTDR